MINKMEDLSPNIKTQVDALIQKAMDSFNPTNIDVSVLILKEAWELLPETKENWAESFLISKYITHVYFNAKQFDNALLWAKQFHKSYVKRSYGESEFMLAKTLYELERYEEAIPYFTIAKHKSFDGKVARVFTGEKDPKYLAFYKKNEPK